MADLEHTKIFQKRREHGERGRLLYLIRRAPAAKQAAATVLAARSPFAMRQRDIASLVWRHRQREPAQLGLHRIETVGLYVERDKADVARALDDGAQSIDRAYGLVF